MTDTKDGKVTVIPNELFMLDPKVSDPDAVYFVIVNSEAQLIKTEQEHDETYGHADMSCFTEALDTEKNYDAQIAES